MDRERERSTRPLSAGVVRLFAVLCLTWVSLAGHTADGGKPPPGTGPDGEHAESQPVSPHNGFAAAVQYSLQRSPALSGEYTLEPTSEGMRLVGATGAVTISYKGSETIEIARTGLDGVTWATTVPMRKAEARVMDDIGLPLQSCPEGAGSGADSAALDALLGGASPPSLHDTLSLPCIPRTVCRNCNWRDVFFVSGGIALTGVACGITVYTGGFSGAACAGAAGGLAQASDSYYEDCSRDNCSPWRDNCEPQPPTPNPEQLVGMAWLEWWNQGWWDIPYTGSPDYFNVYGPLDAALADYGRLVR